MYIDKLFVSNKIKNISKMVTFLAIFALVFEIIIILILTNGIYNGKTIISGFIIAIVIFIVCDLMCYFIIRLYLYKTIKDIEINEDEVLFICHKKKYKMLRNHKINITYGFFGESVIINFNTSCGKFVKLYTIKYRQEGFKRIDNVNYGFLNILK